MVMYFFYMCMYVCYILYTLYVFYLVYVYVFIFVFVYIYKCFCMCIYVCVYFLLYVLMSATEQGGAFPVACNSLPTGGLRLRAFHHQQEKTERQSWSGSWAFVEFVVVA